MSPLPSAGILSQPSSPYCPEWALRWTSGHVEIPFLPGSLFLSLWTRPVILEEIHEAKLLFCSIPAPRTHLFPWSAGHLKRSSYWVPALSVHNSPALRRDPALSLDSGEEGFSLPCPIFPVCANLCFLEPHTHGTFQQWGHDFSNLQSLKAWHFFILRIKGSRN